MMASTVMVRRRNWNLRQSAGTYWWGREQGRNEEARRHLGLETQRQWSDLAILRTTPALLGLFSLVTLWAARLEAERGISPECVRWYPKRAPTFSDALALVRRELWMAPTFASSPDHRDVLKVPADVLDHLMRVACRPP
jgi:hypothetical protein